MKLRYFFLYLLFSTSIVYLQADINENIDTTNSTNGKTFFTQRSQGNNLARRIVGEEFLLAECGKLTWLQGPLSITWEYTRSFDRNDLGTYFSLNKTPKMLFAGDNAPDDIVAIRDVRAEYFGLASDFNGVVEFRPQMENVILDVNLRFHLDRILCGLYVDIGLPVNWTRFGMNLQQEIQDSGTVIDIGLGVNNPPAFSHSIIQAYNGINGGIPIAGITIENLNSARINGRQTKTSIANLEFVLGYNAWCNDYGHFGFNARIAAPTGTRPQGEFVFEPVVGNGKHLQIGAGLSGHYTIWQDITCYEESFSLWVEAEVHHLTNSQQKRTFDITKNGSGSRYLQLKKFNPDNTFTGLIIPAANITTLDTDVNIAAAGEAVLMFNYQRCGFLFDVGYNIWGRSKEKIKIRGTIPEFLGVGGKIEALTDDRTKSNATISTDGSPDGISSTDNVYLTIQDINSASAISPSAISHKIFAHVSYLWNCCGYSPFFGVGGEAEFSGRKNHALPQWGAWIKIGLVH